jgi:class 3 adenylate cyclase/YHS domain-containing protein
VRVRRTFAFVDLCGFTALTSEQGDETAVASLTGFRLAVRETCSRRGVRIAKWLGDGAMLVCVETEPIIGAVIELEHRLTGGRLALRTGLTIGDVIIFEGDDYIGHAVNLAARLCELAKGHEVLAAPELEAYAPPWVHVEHCGEREIRSLGAVELIELSLCAGADPVVDPVCRLPLPPEGVTVTRATASGGIVAFCSESCAETWDGRPTPESDRGVAGG